MSIDSDKFSKGSCEEDITVVSVTEVYDATHQGVEARREAERRLVGKLDARFLPTVVIIFLMNYIDRSAITAARLKGLQTDLHLSDVQYDTVLAIFYASYCPAQIPSNVLLNYVSRPSIYIGANVVFWGLMSALTGTTRNQAGIMVCRIFVGLPEAAFYPGCIYLLSRWYTRKELTLRTAILTAGQLLANAFGSLWAAGVLARMDNVMGIAAWRWLFYIEGAATIFIGVLAIWSLPDYPNNTRWLTPEERHLAQVRISEDTGEADQDSQQASVFDGLKMAIKDPKLPVFMVLCCSQVLGISFTNFFPTLTATLGYSTTHTLLMAAPPWIFTTIVTVINARHADVTGERFFHHVGPLWLAMVGCIIAVSTMQTGARYFAMFLMASASAAYTVVIVWVSCTFARPPAKRSAAIGIVNGFANMGSLMGSYVWPARWGPEYHPSMIIVLGALALCSSLSFGMRTWLVWENKHMDHAHLDSLDDSERERIEEAARLEGITLEEAVKRRVGFRYLY